MYPSPSLGHVGFSSSLVQIELTGLSYMQFHPLAYIVKLKIELSMADLIAKIARQQNPSGHSSDKYYGRSQGTVTRGATTMGDCLEDGTLDGKKPGQAQVTVTTTIEMHTMEADDCTSGNKGAQSMFNHGDTDTLIEPVAPFDVDRVRAEVLKDAAYQGAGGSVSSYNSDHGGPIVTKDQS